MTVDLRPVTEATRYRLAAAVGIASAHVTDRGDAVPAFVVHQVPGASEFWRGLDDEHADGIFAYQVTCVGSTWDQAQWLRTQAIDALTVQPPSGVARVKCETVGRTDIDRDVDPAVFVCTPLFHMTIV